MTRIEFDPRDLSREEPVWFSGPTGRLEGLWRPAPRPVAPRGVIVVAHPHPAYGGTMRNKVVFHVARTLNAHLGVASLRFNFRGVEESEGTYDAGRGEIEDLRAAWREARARVPGRPLVAAGFSFGAAMTLLAAAAEAQAGGEMPAALAVLGLPVHRFPLPRPFPRPIALAAVHGGADGFTAPQELMAYLDAWPGPLSYHVEPGADHFLDGRLPEAVGFLARATRARLEAPGI